MSAAVRSERSGRRRVIAAGGLVIAVVVLLLPELVTHAFHQAGYMPHGHCYLWQPRLVALHAVSDLLIGVSYTAISGTLAVLVYRSHRGIPYHWMVAAFGLFIVACGMTHFMEVWTLWQPVYWLSGDVKLVTAIASVGTAIALPPLVPRILALIRAEDVAREKDAVLAEHSAALAAAEDARTKAEAADRAKDQFLAMVSHELRAPLSPILAWARMLRLDALDEDKRARALEAIERNAVLQAQLVEDLLDVSRIVSGKLRLDVRPTALDKVVEAAVESVRASADAKQVKLHVVLDPRAGMVRGDPDRLQQVVWNLLSNAVKFTPKGGRVQVGLERVSSHLEISVSDTGHGIPLEMLGRVFERFWQGTDGAQARRGGLGLGLAIVRHLVELHGGEVTVHSDGPGRGATFRVALPIMPVVESRPGVERRHPAAGEHALAGGLPRLDGVRVLVVDDEPEANELVQDVLAACGAEVRVAASVRQALAILDRWRPDAIVSDIGMPEEDGYALVRQVRARPPERGRDVPCIALTAYARVEDRVRVLTSGFQLHVTKPVEPLELVAAVGSAVRSPAVTLDRG